MFDDPKDEMTKGPHSEPDSDEIDSIMGEPLEDASEEDPFGAADPLEEALTSAGFKVSPDVLEQVRALVEKPAAKPAAKPGLGKEPPAGGAVPAGMKTSDIAR